MLDLVTIRTPSKPPYSESGVDLTTDIDANFASLNEALFAKAVITIGVESGNDYVAHSANGDIKFQEALDDLGNAGGGTLRVNGIVNVRSATGPLQIPSNVAVIGNGCASNVIQTGTSNVALFTNADGSTGNSNIRIANIKLTKNQISGYPSNNPVATIRFDGASNTLIENVYFSYGGCHFRPNTTYRDTATSLTNGNNRHNVVKNCFFDENCLVCVVFSQASHCQAVSNIGHGYDSPFSALGAWDDVKFLYNVVYDQGTSGYGIEANHVEGLEAWRNLQIKGNYLYNSIKSGININGSDVEEEFVEDTDITDNHVVGSGQYGIILEQQVRGFKISGNHIRNTSRGGIQLSSDMFTITKGVVTGNVLRNVGIGGTRPYGIELRTTTTAGRSISDVLIHGNVVYDSQDTPTTAVGIRITTDNAADSITSITVRDNDIRDIGIPLQVAGSGTAQIHGSGNSGVNPNKQHAQGNVTGATTFDRVNGDVITATLTGDITVTLTAGKVAGDELTLILSQDGTGSRLVTWPSNFKKAGGTLTLSTGAGAVDVIKMRFDGTNWREVSRSLNLS